MVYWLIALGFLLSLGCYAEGNNQVNIQVESLDYTLPENHSGVAGTLVFPEVKLTWDEMRVNLKNGANALDAKITIRPEYMKFNAPRAAITIPLDNESSFFTMKRIALNNSFILLNKSFLNFDGSYFQVSDGTNLLTLDEFNASCFGHDGINMTTFDGLVEGCLTKLLINGKNEGELAGAKLEYKGEGDFEFYFKSRLKEFRLIDNVIALDLNTAVLDVENYKVEIGPSILSCEKPANVISFSDEDIDRLYYGCLNSTHLDRPEIKINNVESGSSFAVKVVEAKTTPDKFYANIEKVGIQNVSKITEMNDIVIECLKYEKDEFFDLHKVLSSCFEKGNVSVLNMVKTSSDVSSDDESFWDSWFSNDDDSKDENTIKELNLDLNQSYGLLTANDLKIPFLPRSDLKIAFDVYHHNVENQDKYIELKIKKIRFGILGVSGFMVKPINWLLEFFVDEKSVSVKGKKIKIYL